MMGKRRTRIPVACQTAFATAPAVPVGAVKVGFVYVPAQSASKATANPKSRLPRPGDKTSLDENPTPATNPIPMHLRDAGKSTVTFTVEEGKTNTFDYDLTKQ